MILRYRKNINFSPKKKEVWIFTWGGISGHFLPFLPKDPWKEV
jgi:hypothetical protein